MRLAILMTNTDESSFAQAHPKDGQKFSELLWRVRPNWSFDVFSVKDGVFPKTLDYDGLIITGSPASVHDGADWIAQLENLVRDAVERKIPMFGACFGHQVIARALGAQVTYNPTGWVLGKVTTEFTSDQEQIPIYAAHKEQVTTLPQDARIVARTDGCEIAGFAIEDHVLTTQYHPEMTQAFVADLLEAFEDEIGRDVTQTAQQTLGTPTDVDALAEWIALFFENAQSKDQ